MTPLITGLLSFSLTPQPRPTVTELGTLKRI
jgi:hypothetical protein